MKKYLLLIEDEKLWERFKEIITKDINTEIMDLIKKKINSRGDKKWQNYFLAFNYATRVNEIVTKPFRLQF